MKKLYNDINDRLDEVRFSEIVSGFNKCSYALFNDDKAIINDEVIDKPQEFVANSVAQYNDSLVATYDYSFLPDDLDKATSSIAHEMFHAFQFSNMDFLGLFTEYKEESGLFYDYSVDNISMKYNEVSSLLSAYRNSSKDDLDRFLSIRSLRNKKYANEVMYEKGAETIEGFATYVELLVLKQLNEQLYHQSIKDLIEYLQNSDNYFSIRELSYKVGALLLLTLDELGIYFGDVLLGKSFISDLCSFEYVEPKIERLEVIESSARTRLQDNEKTISDFLSENCEEIKFDKIIGYNPMGALRHNDKLLIKHLVIAVIDGEQQSLNGDFCLVVDENREWVNLYKKID